MGIQVTFPFLQAIYQRITKISRFLTPPKYKNQPVCSHRTIMGRKSMLRQRQLSRKLSEVGLCNGIELGADDVEGLV